MLARAVTALATGDAQTALHAASDACYKTPGDKRAHYAYGQAWLAAGEPARALQAFAAAVQIDGFWADAWVNVGVASYRLGRIEDAKTAMREALRCDPCNAAALGNLGAFMRICGQADESEALLRQTLDGAPGNDAARLNLAAELMQDDRADDALKLLNAAPPPQAGAALRQWLLTRSLALLQLRRIVEAEADVARLDALGPAPEVEALRRWRLVLAALARNEHEAAADYAAAMEAALRDNAAHMLPEHRVMAYFDLARFWSGRRDPARAMAQWTSGHALLKQTQPFSRAEHAAFVDACIKSFPRARIMEGPRAGNSDPVPVFIVGMPRSGTTLCEQILAAHPAAHGAGERSALGAMFARLGGGGADAAWRVAALDAAALDAAAAEYLAELHALAPDRLRIVDKMPGNYSYLGLAALMLPGARIIHCVRDPRDIGLSIFTFRFYGYHPYAHDLADLGFAIAEQARLMTHWRAALPNPVLEVRLSDWVYNFDATLARVLDHVGLPPDPACARFYEQTSRVRTVSYAQVRQPVNARGLGRWRAYADQLGPLIDALNKAGQLDDWA